jgi:acyl carrier protein
MAGYAETIRNYIRVPFMTNSMMTALEGYIASKILRQPGRKISPEEPLISSGLVDSFSLVDLALYVEDTFDIHIGDTELNAQTFDSLNQLVTLIESRQVK